MIIAGVDYSLTCPAVFIFDTTKTLTYRNGLGIAFPQKGKTQSFHNVSICPQDFVSRQTNSERYWTLAEGIIGKLLQNRVDLVAIEDYALRAVGKIADIAEATGIFKAILQVQLDIPVLPYPPTSIKKTFSGKGNANKEVMASAFYEKEKFQMHEEIGGKLGGNPASDLIDSYAVLTHYLSKENSNGQAS